MKPSIISLAVVFLALSCAHQGPKQTGTIPPNTPDTGDQVRSASVKTFVVKPATKEFEEERLSELKLQPGFKINVFAEGFDGPRGILVAPNGDVYVAERKKGRVVRLKDTSGDGKANERVVVASGLGEDLQGVHGLALKGRSLYMVTDRELYRADLKADGSLGARRRIFNDLPDGGQHPNRTMDFGPDGLLYLSIGSTCNSCPEPNKEAATMLQVSRDEKSRKVWASGLRNTIGFGWHPVTRELWGMDHNTDYLGDDLPPEELNLLSEGKHYGWPECWGKQEVDWMYHSEPSKGDSRRAFCASTEPSVLEYQAHAAPMMLVFYTGSSFPAEYRNDAFVAMRGSWNRYPPYGYKIVRIKFGASGKPEGFEDFVSGWLAEDKKSQFARPMGLAQARDGSLLMTEDGNGVIYRISYDGQN
jgi:glucose/arabinose dehydrogenase